MKASKWYVFYTKSRHEKKVANLLQQRGYEVFLPLHKVIRQWSDRKKKIEVPLFSSYIFVKTEESKVREICTVPGVAWPIRHNGKPAILQLREYELIKRFLATGLTIEVEPLEGFKQGDYVQVMDGPLKGAVGQVTAENPGRLTIILEAIGQVIRVELNPYILKKC